MFDFSLGIRNTAGGYIGRYNPLINYKWNTTVSSDYITDGIELVTNGGFDSDTDWTLGTGITISNGEVHFLGTPNVNINQFGLEIDEVSLYRVSFDITSYTSGSVDINLGGSNRQLDFASTVGSYEWVGQKLGGTAFYFQEDSATGFIGSIDNISIQKVIQKPNTMYLKDSGTSPKHHAELLSGQGVKFNGVDQSIMKSDGDVSLVDDFTVLTTFVPSTDLINRTILGSNTNDYIKFNGTTSIYIKINNVYKAHSIPSVSFDELHTLMVKRVSGMVSIEIDGIEVVTENEHLGAFTIGKYIGSLSISQYFSGTLKDLYIFNDTLTPTEIAKYSSNPNGFFQDVQDGVIDNCVLNMPLDGKDKYVRDYVNYSEGAELVVDGDFSTDLANWTQNAGAVGVATIVDGSLLYSTPHADYAETKQTFQSVIGETYLVTFDITTEATGVVYYQYGRANMPSVTAVGSYSFIVVSTHTDGFAISARTDVVVGIDNISVKQLSGIHEISNFTTASRTDADNLNYGTQGGNFLKDGLWRGDLSNYYEMDGTQVPALNVPMTDTDLGSRFAIEFVISRELIATSTYLLFSSSTDGIRLYANYGTNSIMLRFYNSGINTQIHYSIPDTAFHHVIFEYDGATANMILDGVVVDTGAYTFTPSGLKFSDSIQPSPIGTLAMFKIWDEANYDKTYDRAKSVELGTRIVAKEMGYLIDASGNYILDTNGDYIITTEV